MRLFALVLLVSAASPGLALADAPAGAEQQARGLFERGLALAEEGRLAEAAVLFERSHEQVPRPSTALNWAIVLERQGRGAAALRALDAFEVQRDAAGDADRRDASAMRRRLGERLATLTLRVIPETARLEVDGIHHEGTGEERVLILDPGPHVLRLEAAGHAPRRVPWTARAGDGQRETIRLDRLSTESPPAQRLRRRRAIGISAAAAVLAAVATAVALAARSPGLRGGSTGNVLDAHP